MASIKRTEIKKVSYSTMEQQVIDLLSHGSIMTSKELVKQIYDGRDVPYYARASVTKCLSGLIEKLEYNKEAFMITKTKPGGPYPTQYKKTEVKSK